jgi:dolichyl-phosphate beta-glucosyltransferase
MKTSDKGEMVSLILPVYNCFHETARSLPLLIQRLQQIDTPFEVIIVDDNSENPGLFQQLAAANGCLCLTNKKNHGKGYSVRRGFAQAKGTILIFMDGDFPFEMEVIERMIELFVETKTDIVIGDRTLDESVYPAETKKSRKLGSSVLSFFTSRFLTPRFSDTQCGIKGFRKSTAGQIFGNLVVNGFSFDVEILFVASRKKYFIHKIPVIVKKQNITHVRVLYHGIEMLANICRIYFRKWRGLYHL